MEKEDLASVIADYADAFRKNNPLVSIGTLINRAVLQSRESHACTMHPPPYVRKAKYLSGTNKKSCRNLM